MDQDSLLNLMLEAFGDTPPKGRLWFHFLWQADTELGVGVHVCECAPVITFLEADRSQKK